MFLKAVTYYFLYLLVRGLLSYWHFGPFYLPPLGWDLFNIIDIILFFPVLEELTVRYWLYGKNNYLRVGFFISFLLQIVATILESAIQLNLSVYGGNKGYGLFIYAALVAIGWVCAAILIKTKQINVNRLILFLNKLKDSWITFVLLVIYDVAYHLQSLNFIDFYEVQRQVIGATILVYVAKKYGMPLAIFVHILNNILAVSVSIENFDILGITDRMYFYLTFPLSLWFLWLFQQWQKKLRQNPNFDPVPIFKQKLTRLFSRKFTKL